MTKNNTKRALTTSALAMVLCVAMLIGTTFAWFTDTASTAVNKIQAGNLNVALEMATAWDSGTGAVTEWKSAEGQTLQFKKASGATTDEKVLWEPGCTYELPEIRIVNKGDLALKYKIVLSGIKGDAKLNEAITWTIGGLDLDDEGHLTAGATSEVLTIKGHMKEEAGNEYQGLSIDGIGITVVATQDTVEYDSKGYQYDALAQYPVFAVEDAEINAETKETLAVTTIKSDEVVSDNDATPLATVTIPEGAKTTSKDDATSIPLTLSIKQVETDDANFTVEVDETQSAKTLEVKIDGLAGDNDKPVIVTIYVGDGLKNFALYHYSDPMTLMGSADGVTGATIGTEVDSKTVVGEYFYNDTTGIVTMATKTFSPFTYIYDATVVETSDQLEESLKDGGTTILSKDISFEGTEHSDGDHLDTIISGEYIHLVLNNTLTSDNIISEKSWGLIRVENTVNGTGEITATSKFVISANQDGQFINTTKTVSSICIHGGDVIVNSGYFECTNGASCFFAYTDSDAVNSDGPFSLTINGGTFKADTVVEVIVGMNCEVTINGGTFYGWDPSTYVDTNTHTVTTSDDNGTTVYTVIARS